MKELKYKTPNEWTWVAQTKEYRIEISQMAVGYDLKLVVRPAGLGWFDCGNFPTLEAAKIAAAEEMEKKAGK